MLSKTYVCLQALEEGKYNNEHIIRCSCKINVFVIIYYLHWYACKQQGHRECFTRYPCMKCDFLITHAKVKALGKRSSFFQQE
jgi:hypothetical protein